VFFVSSCIPLHPPFLSKKHAHTTPKTNTKNTHPTGAGCITGIYSSSDEVCIPLPPYAQRSGPRRTIYADPATTTAAIVTCGGLCPGLNDVVQNIVFTLADYGVPAGQVYGVRYGLRGFYARGAKPVDLTPDRVQGIHLDGGTILGTSRGGADIPEIVRRLALWGVTQLFVVGGNGGNAAAHAIHEECERQGVVVSVVGVPKSIDNDILLIDRCFG
jgi:6-phosphofructokinase 1